MKVFNSQLKCKRMVEPQKSLVVYLLDQLMEIRSYLIGESTFDFYHVLSNCGLKKVLNTKYIFKCRL